MKQYHWLYSLLFFISFYSNSTYSQITDVVQGLQGPKGSVVSGNIMYVAELYGDKISKIDISQPNPIAVDVVTGLDNPWGLVLEGTTLYFSEEGADKISKIDISQVTPTVTNVATGLNSPCGMALQGNYLYITQRDNGKISRIDTTASMPIVEDVVTNLEDPQELAFNGDELYIYEIFQEKISKINITDATPTPVNVVFSSISGAPISGIVGLAIKGNTLYTGFTGNGNGLPGFTIVTADLSTSPATVKDLVSGIYAGDFLFDGDDLYVSQLLENKISKVAIDALPETPTDFHYSTSYILGLEFKGNELFYTAQNEDKLFKVDAANGALARTEVANGLNTPRDLIFYGDQIFISGSFSMYTIDTSSSNTNASYVGSYPSTNFAIKGTDLYYTNTGDGKILKLDINDTSQIPITVVSGLNGPWGIAFKGNELYIAEFFGDKISKINISVSNPTIIDVATNINDPIALAFKNDELYFGDTIDNKIYKIDTSQSNPMLIEVVSEATIPTALAFRGNILYISEGSKITTFDTSAPLSVNQNIRTDDFVVFPNPVINELNLKTTENIEKIAVYDVLGRLIRTYEVNQNKINLSTLQTGNYYLKVYTDAKILHVKIIKK